MDSRIPFVPSIRLVDPEMYTLYKLYSISIVDKRTNLHHILPFTNKYIATNDDSWLYTIIQEINSCKPNTTRILIYQNRLPYPIESDVICEA